MNYSVRGFTLSIISLLMELIALVVLFTTDFRMGAGQGQGVLILILSAIALLGDLVALGDFKRTKDNTGLKTAGLAIAVPALIGGIIMVFMGLGGSGLIKL